jgi:hypothetical protein
MGRATASTARSMSLGGVQHLYAFLSRTSYCDIFLISCHRFFSMAGQNRQV